MQECCWTVKAALAVGTVWTVKAVLAEGSGGLKRFPKVLHEQIIINKSINKQHSKYNNDTNHQTGEGCMYIYILHTVLADV